MKNESLDDKIAVALTADDVSVETLEELIAECEKAISKAKEAASAAHARAVDPRVVDPSALTRAIEQDHYHERYKAAYQQLVAKRDKTERIAAHAAWLREADQVEAARAEVEAEFTSTYTAFVNTFIAIAARVQAVNQSASHLNRTRLNGNCHVEGLANVAAVIAGVKLPNPARTTEYLWPSPAPAVRIDMPLPYDRHYSAEWWQAKADDAARLKQAQDAAEKQREDAAAAAHPNTPQWWKGETFGPGKAV